MSAWTFAKISLRIGGILLLLYLVVVVLFYLRQRAMIFFPSHGSPSTNLKRWQDGGKTIGYCREVPAPRTIWLMMHGNAGQAADREYGLPCMLRDESLYVLEYPGYGSRDGKPSLKSMNRAASEAYQLLRSRNPSTPVCVLAESIGSGPACTLARESPAPDKIVLIVPFDSLANVAAKMFPFLPVRLLLWDSWDNVESLKQYTGPVDIFAALHDEIVPVEHARALARQIPSAHLVEIDSGHNDWVESGQVRIRR